jgi:hypothetical protein
VPKAPDNVLSMTAGMAGKLPRERVPEPWTGAENVDGRVVGYVVDVVVVGAAVIVDSLGLAEGVVVGEILTASRVPSEPTFTPKPPTLRPRRGDAVTAELVRTAMRVESFILKYRAERQKSSDGMKDINTAKERKVKDNERSW